MNRGTTRIIISTVFMLFMFLQAHSQVQEYWDNDQKKAEGSFIFEDYNACCFSGSCVKKNIYKTGHWIYWYENGQKMAEGDYILKSKKIKNNCKQKVKVHYGKVFRKRWKCWDESGNEKRMNKEMKRKIQ